MAVVSIATLKTYFETGDFPTQSQFVDLIDTLENGSTSTYKRYVATLTQTGTSAPVATILENTLGGTVVWSRLSAGVFYATLAGVMTQNKTFISSDLRANGDLFVTSGWDTVNRVIVASIASSTGVATDFSSATSYLSIEIRVYP